MRFNLERAIGVFVALVIVGTVGVFVYSAVSGNSADKSERPSMHRAPAPAVRETTTEIVEDTPDVVIFEVGENATFGDYGITVKEVTTKDDDEARHVDILIEVENKGKKPIQVDSGYFKLTDASGREFDPSDSVSFEGDPIFMYDSINPGLKLTKKVKFDIPTDVTTATLAVRDSVFDFGGAEYMLFNLGEFK